VAKSFSRAFAPSLWLFTFIVRWIDSSLFPSALPPTNVFEDLP
jgi:hypothetical protein